jgi:hypothetical protein
MSSKDNDSVSLVAKVEAFFFEDDVCCSPTSDPRFLDLVVTSVSTG